ncbi:hypothetical protein [Thalassococcus sp. S3]|uniref:hypothetical protein n=1 Tax=Thalassococcus sp. S3 TaxID=2017482 RepID=UPI0010242102|nr:hypothetical protein [Thalassococcus sp. S3]QBF32203.1 hypothetical protein CFI11_13385 [Thalassococcus sp. S3]
MTMTASDPDNPRVVTTAAMPAAGPARAGGDRFLKRFVVVTVMIVSSLIALGIIFVTAFLPVFLQSNPPEALVNWGGIIIGFYFGTFAGLLKDWLSDEKGKGDTA